MVSEQRPPEDQTSANVRAIARAQLERLEADLRVLSPIGIERAAWGWDRHASSGLSALHEAERAALHAVETAPEAPEWDEWRRRLFSEVEGRRSFVAWQAEHQMHEAHVHKAEQAAFAAALGVFARAWISHARYATLVSAMAEALPWLLPEQPPSPAV
jgi:hypothetical protein